MAYASWRQVKDVVRTFGTDLASLIARVRYNHGLDNFLTRKFYLDGACVSAPWSFIYDVIVEVDGTRFKAEESSKTAI